MLRPKFNLFLTPCQKSRLSKAMTMSYGGQQSTAAATKIFSLWSGGELFCLGIEMAIGKHKHKYVAVKRAW